VSRTSKHFWPMTKSCLEMSSYKRKLESKRPHAGHQQPTEVFWRSAAGKSLNQGRGLGRTWSPMVEAVSAREMIPGARTEWDIVPQMQVTLNKRQHIRANFGVSIPVRNTAGRAAQLVFYLLWDFFDGGIRDGWK
jgi:hypothetical protein